MKKIIAILLCILFSILLVSCKTAKNDVSSKVESQIVTSDQLTSLDVTKNIPTGGVYYQNNKWSFAYKINDFELGKKYQAGDTIPDVQFGDIFVYENIIYVYNAHLTSSISGFVKDETLSGWGAAYVPDVSHKDIKILNSIGNKPVVSAAYFLSGKNLSNDFNSISIPANIKDITGIFDSSVFEGTMHLELNSTPTKFKDCLLFAGDPVIKDGNVSFICNNNVWVEGQCDNDIKMDISGEKTNGTKTYIK